MWTLSVTNSRPSSAEPSWQYMHRRRSTDELGQCNLSRRSPLCAARCATGSASRGFVCNRQYLFMFSATSYWRSFLCCPLTLPLIGDRGAGCCSFWRSPGSLCASLTSSASSCWWLTGTAAFNGSYRCFRTSRQTAGRHLKDFWYVLMHARWPL